MRPQLNSGTLGRRLMTHAQAYRIGVVGATAGVASIALSAAGLFCVILLPQIAFLPSLLAAVFAYRAVSSSPTLLPRLVAFLALIVAIPAVGLSCMALFFPFGW